MDSREQIRGSMHEILPNLWLGGCDAAANAKYLVDNGISFVISINHHDCLNTTHKDYAARGIERRQFHLQDEPGEDIFSILWETSNIIETKIQEGKAVLVHCTMGRSRSATVVIAYIMQRFGTFRADTTRLVWEKRKVIKPNAGFSMQLARWGHHVRSTMSHVEAKEADEDTKQYLLAVLEDQVNQLRQQTNERLKMLEDLNRDQQDQQSNDPPTKQEGSHKEISHPTDGQQKAVAVVTDPSSNESVAAAANDTPPVQPTVEVAISVTVPSAKPLHAFSSTAAENTLPIRPPPS